MLASDGATHAQCQLMDVVGDAQGALDLVGVVAIDEQAGMQPAAANVGCDGHACIGDGKSL